MPEARASALLPFEEVFEKGLAVRRGQGAAGFRTRREEVFETGAQRLVRGTARCPQLREHVLGDAVTGPSRHRPGEINLLPFRLERRLLEALELGKIGFDEA